MSVGFPKLSWWLWSGKRKDERLSKKSSKISSADLNELELDVLKFPAVGVDKSGSSSGRVRRKSRDRDKAKIDKEHDSVVVPTDGGEFSSDCDSDGSDWSIGWSEPHAPGFLSEDEIDNGFGVLVRCYGRGQGGKRGNKKKNVENISRVPDLYVTDSQKHMERWLSSLQGGS